VNDSAPPAPRARDRAATEERLLAAVGTVLARDGFAALGVNAVAREAGVDKVLIYRYFGGLDALVARWGASGRFWPRVDDLLARHPGLPSRPAAERWALFFDHFIDELRARPLTLEILAAEVAHRNQLTAILETEREAWGAQALQVLGGPELARRPEVGSLTLLLVAGVQYLLLRGRLIRRFGPLDLGSDATWAAVKADLLTLAGRLLPVEA
jgi:AcrR family transcriptional regulator